MNFNEWKKLQAEKLGAITSHDDDPLSPVGREGMDLGKAARPDAFDPGDTNPSQSSPAATYSPVSNLPTSVSAEQVRRESLKRDPYSQGGEQ